jgi:hypothetical protein
MLGGSIIGGIFGAKGGAAIEGKFVVTNTESGLPAKPPGNIAAGSDSIKSPGKFPSERAKMTELLGVEPKKVSVTADGTSRVVWEPNSNTRIRYESHPDGLRPNDAGFNPRHHGEHYHVELKPSNLSWNQANKQGLITKAKPEDYVLGNGTGFLPGEAFPGK